MLNEFYVCRLCIVCAFAEERPKFWLRGLCQDSFFDREYTLMPPDDVLSSYLYFSGKSLSFIAWVSENFALMYIRMGRFVATFLHFEQK
jgi:hypothetical protein